MKKKSVLFFLAGTVFLFSGGDFFSESGNKNSEAGVSIEKNPLLELDEDKTAEEMALEYAQSKVKDAEEKTKTQLEELELKAKIKEAEKAAKEKLKEKTDSHLGVVYIPEKKLDVNAGKIRLSLRGGNTSSFNVYAKGESKTETALFSSYDSSRSTFFVANVNGVPFRLNKDAGVVKELRRLASGAQLAYIIEKKAQIVLDFVPVASVLGTPEDMVRVTVYSTNISDSVYEEIEIKAVFDTILGEGTDCHFATSSGLKINGEMQFDSFKKERSIFSGNGNVSLQIILDGKAVTPVEKVSFANRNVLMNSPWIPVIATGKSFNSVLAYNNSAVAVNWPVHKLKPGETGTIVFYIACGTDKMLPNGLFFVDALEKSPQSEGISIESVKKEELEVKKPEVDFIIPPVDDYQLNPEYIQNLINRINSLQSNPEFVDRNEIKQLNAELDAIMKKIRQRQ